MSDDRIAFIVGAGASAEFGFPTGDTLLKEIVELIRPDYSQDVPLCVPILNNEVIFRELGLNYNEIVSLCAWMADTLPLHRSIDDFLDKHSLNGDAVSVIGKIAISRIISKYEELSSLALAKDKKIDWRLISQTWIGKLWSLKNVGGSRKQSQNPLPNISIINFNYDRCVEQFISLALNQSYKLSFSECEKIVKKIPCEHVYGSLGSLKFSMNGTNFGEKTYPYSLPEMAKSIKTFTEQIDSQTLENIKKILNNSNIIVFLGFSFGKINRDLIKKLMSKDSIINSVFATSFGMHHVESLAAFKWMRHCFGVGNIYSGLWPDKCAEFMDGHSIILTS